MKRFTFKELEVGRLYKNIHCYDDQLYRRSRSGLYTKSGMSAGRWSVSSASKTEPVFLELKTKLPTRKLA